MSIMAILELTSTKADVKTLNSMNVGEKNTVPASFI